MAQPPPPSRGLPAALFLSAILHGLLLVFAGPSSRLPIPGATAPLRATIGPERFAPPGATAPWQPRAQDRPQAKPTASVEKQAARPDDSAVRHAPRESEPLPVVRFHPDEYLPPSEVDLVALPANQDLFELLPLTGSQPANWLLRLFVDETGVVSEIQVVETDAAERSTEELKTILRANRFMPAQKQGTAVKSQKMIEFSFDPTKGPQMSVPVLVPSATEK